MSPTNSELEGLLRPFITVGKIFGSNWLTDKRWLRIILRLYCALMFLLNILTFVVCCTYFDSSDGIKMTTMFKLYMVVYNAISIVCHLSNIRLQSNMSDILAKANAINKGSIPSQKWFSRLVQFSSVGVLNVCFSFCASIYLVLVGPMDFPFKPKTFGSYGITTAYCCVLSVVCNSFPIGLLYNIIFCTLLNNYCGWFQSQMSESTEKLTPELIKEWFSNYKRFAELVELIDSLLGICCLLVNGLLFGLVVISLLLVGRGVSMLSTTSVIFAAFGTVGLIPIICGNVIPAIIVNEKIERTAKILWNLSESDDVYANPAVQLELQTVLRKLKYRGTPALTSAKFFSPTRYTFLTMASLAISYFIMFFRMDSSSVISAITNSNFTNGTM